jgi:hypothetical protein
VKQISKEILYKMNLTWLFLISTPVFIFFLYLNRFSPEHIMIILFLATALYLFCVLIHHFRDKTLSLEIMIEYVLIAILALVVVQSLLL